MTTDASGRPEAVPASSRRGYRRSSRYLKMRDGVSIALDIYLPKDLDQGERLPAILRQTRYYRSTLLRRPFRWILDRPADLTRSFVSHGYAWIDVDVRGSGASGGWRPQPWGPEEVADGAEIVDWIVGQPWSNGRVGAMGVSYDGTAAEFLAVNQHPAVKAIAPRFSLFDTYADVALPGGVHLSWFTETWGEFNRALDQRDLTRVFPWLVKLFAVGPRPVDADRSGKQLSEHVRSHAWNYDVHRGALAMTFRDDVVHGQGGLQVDRFSPHAVWERVESSGVAVFSYSGWLDGAYAHAAIKRHRTLSNPHNRLILGPWNHGGTQHIDPRRAERRARFDHASELLRFFEGHLRGAPPPGPADGRVSYYTLVEGRWKHAQSWPPPSEPRLLYLGSGGGLSYETPSATEGFDEYRVDPEAGTGQHSRWNSLMSDRLRVGYPDRAKRDSRLLVYQTPPLARPTEVTGHPLVHLYLASDAPDGALFAYLEDVSPAERVIYVTEGQLRVLHRKQRPQKDAPHSVAVPYRSFLREDASPLVAGEVTLIEFDLLPISYLFEAGHSIRLALSGADADHFAQLPGPPALLQLQRNARCPSHVVLPVVSR